MSWWNVSVRAELPWLGEAWPLSCLKWRPLRCLSSCSLQKKKNNLATVLAFCSAKKRKKCFIAIIRDLLKKVLDANYLTNCRRAKECSDLLFIKMSSPHLEIKTGFLFPHFLKGSSYVNPEVEGRESRGLAQSLALKSSIGQCCVKTRHGGLYLRRHSWLWSLSEAAIVIIGTFPAAQLCTRSVFIFGSFFLSRARISRILWTLVWLADWSHHARLSCDCTFSH